MKYKQNISKKDIITFAVCIVFLLTTMGSIGAAGRRRAKEMICLSNLKNWGVVFDAFTKDNDGRFPYDTGDWISDLYPYYRDTGLLLCPEATRTEGSIGGGERGDAHHAWRDDGLRGSYGLNQYCSSE